MSVLDFIGRCLYASFAMFWSVLWSLLFGFILSAMVQAYVPKGGLAKSLGRAGLRELSLATLLGAASSSCSYAAAATAKSIFKRGADFTTSMAFMFASTNLVIELGLILWRLMGWPFVVAEWFGGIVLIAIFALLARIFFARDVVERGREHVEELKPGAHEHDHGDMLAPGSTLWQKLRSGEGWRYISHYFQMDWSMLQTDLILGFVIAGFLAIAVPASWWQALYIENAPALLRTIENALVGPIIAVLSFVCSIGNVPLAAVLWDGGSTFGGVIAFLYADLIVLPLIDIYRRYYGWPLTWRMVGVFYAAMVISGLIVEGAFALFHAVPTPAGSLLMAVEHIAWDYTTVLNIVFIVLATVLVWWGNRNGSGHEHSHHDHEHDHAHQ
ncbi:MAG TPA: permease [Candidatus Eremiobacteraceae bacterium]|nr:permease [Candidatus Eremiobacteraceae bacterium]